MWNFVGHWITILYKNENKEHFEKKLLPNDLTTEKTQSAHDVDAWIAQTRCEYLQKLKLLQ